MALAKVFRTYRPRLVLAHGGKTPLASPDHYQAELITEAAVFYTRLTKWDEQFGGLPPCNQPVLMYYLIGLRSLGTPHPNCVVVDIGDSLETKLAAIACYQTQFAQRPELLERVRIVNKQQGQAAGFLAGEAFASPSPLGARDLMKLVFST